MDDEEDEAFDLSYRWSWWRPVVIFFALVTQILEAFSRAFENLTVATAAAHNHRIEQEDFRTAVALDIENLGPTEK